MKIIIKECRVLTICLCWIVATSAGHTETIVQSNTEMTEHVRNHTYAKNQLLSDTGYTIYYQKACYYSLQHENELAFFNLKEAIKRGAKGEDVMTDTDFNVLQKDEDKWKDIDSLLRIQYAKRNPGISNPEVGYELWLMWIEDQRFRTLKKNYKLPTAPVNNTAIHSIHLHRLKEIIKQSGWPKYSDVGIEGGDAAFFVLQHDDAKNMREALQLFIAAAKDGEADLKKTAMMIDRFLAYTEHTQLYGTQAFRKISPGQKREDIPLELYPIADEENLIARRSAIGLEDFIENCTRLGVTYTRIEERKDYKKIAIKKKWKDAGYVL